MTGMYKKYRLILKHSLVFFLWSLFFVYSNQSFATHLPSRIVTSEWLKNHLSSEHLIIIDVQSKEKYLQGHIPGAVNLPVNKTFGAAPRDDLVAPMSQLIKIFSQAGIDFNKDVVIYDDGAFIDAARLIWILEANGHSHVAILDSGLKGWSQQGNPLSNEPVTPLPSNFIPAVNPDRIASKFSTRMSLENPNVVLVDARANEEYMGKESKASRYGHIPKAINIPWENNYRKNELGVLELKSRDELEKMYQDISKDKKIITYCNKGKQSALSHFILRDLGYDVAAYDGSWYEWGNDYSLPIVNPLEQSEER